MTITGSRLVAGLSVAALLAACGSTVQNQGQLVPGSTDGLGQASPGPDGLTTGGGTGVTPGGTGAATGPGGATGGGTTGAGLSTTGGVSQPGGSTGAGSSGGGGGLAGAPGVTPTTIALGIGYCNDCATANSAAGAGGQDPGDTRRYFDAALKDVNSRGGVQGRKLVPVWHSVSVADDIEQSRQEACSTWTEDNKVILMSFQGELVYQCAAKIGAIAIGSGGSGPLFQRNPNMFAPATIRLERLAEVTVKAMVKANWQKPDTTYPFGKIGLITWDDNEYKYAMSKGWLPALHGAGLKETDVRYIAVPQNANALADASSAISNAVLAFKRENIDHVFIGDGPAGIFKGTGLTLLFLQNAKTQGYYPRYGFNGNNAPGWENHPKDEQVGMLAIDSNDTERISDEGIALNPQRERCWGLMRKEGLPVGDAQTQTLAINACETAWFTEALFSRAKGPTLADFIAAGESLGTSYRSPFAYGTRLGPGRHDGESYFRTARYDEACSCMKYTSKPFEP